MTRVAVIDPTELAELVRSAVADALALQPKVNGAQAPALLDRAGLAKALSVSTAALDRLRAEPSFPELKIGDAPRFQLARVLAWLRARSEDPKLRLVSGTR